ncbi:MAG TPA: hypothetical protein VF453_06385 [Burkholderiaceae bacterium]
MTTPTLPPEVARLVHSKDLYELLMNVQNGIDAPGHASMANGVIVMVDKARNALAHLSASAAAQGEAVAWQVWWGIGEMRPHWPPFKTENEARDHASMIRSNTEVRPLYTHPAPPASASAPRAQEAQQPAAWIAWPGGEPPVEGHVVVHYRLRSGAESNNSADGLFWHHDGGEDDIVAYRRAHPAHEGGEDGELPELSDEHILALWREATSGNHGDTTHQFVCWFARAIHASRAQPAAASAAVREALRIGRSWIKAVTKSSHATASERDAALVDLAFIDRTVDRLAAAPDVPPAEVAQAAPLMANGMTEAETSATASVVGLSQAAPVDALPELPPLPWKVPTAAAGAVFKYAEDYARAAQALVRATPAPRVESQAIDAKIGLRELPPIRMGSQEVESLEAAAKERGVILQAHVRDLLRAPRVEAKPLTEEQIREGYREVRDAGLVVNFAQGVKYAERFHGVGTHPEAEGGAS